MSGRGGRGARQATSRSATITSSSAAERRKAKPSRRTKSSIGALSASTCPTIVRDAVAPGPVEEPLHEEAAEALALHLVGHDDGELRFLAAGIADQAGRAQGFAGCLAGGDEGHLAVVVDLHEAGDQGRRQLPDGGEEAPADVRGRDPAEGFGVRRGVLRPDRAHEQRLAGRAS